jgi:hypothetical protein
MNAASYQRYQAGLGSFQFGPTQGLLLNVAGSLLKIAPATGPGMLVLAPVAGALAVAAFITSAFHGCGQTCIEATKVVDQAEPYLRQNLEQYMSGGHTATEQAQALANFDAIWAAVVQGCSDPNLGDAGKRCITERGPSGSLPGHPGVNWFTLYRDPIANDPDVKPDIPSPSTVLPNIRQAFQGNAGPLLLASGAILLLFVLSPRGTA